EGGLSPGTQVLSETSYRPQQLVQLFDAHVRPFMLAGRRGDSLLAAPARSKQLFADLRPDAEIELLTAVNPLEEICAVRRQPDTQMPLSLRLHPWLCVHTPLSVALTVLLVYHVVIALKFW